MSGFIRLRRRSFLWLLTGLFSGSATQLLQGQIVVLDDPLLRLLFRTKESAAVLGAAYLKDAPEERDPHVLRRLLDLQSLDENTGEDGLHALASMIREKHRDDFRYGRTHRLEGWIMTLTELRLCAMVSLARASTETRDRR